MRSYEFDNEMIRAGMNYKSFIELPESTHDYRQFTRSFSGRMTKLRWQIISRFCRRQTYTIPVYSDYDCTGQCCGQSMQFEYKHNQVVIRLNMSYDY